MSITVKVIMLIVSLLIAWNVNIADVNPKNIPFIYKLGYALLLAKGMIYIAESLYQLG